MAGYGDRNHPSEEVLRDIYVKALALEAEPGKSAVIVTADLLGYPREVSDAVAARCEKQFGLTRDRLVLNASHTHSAPVAHCNAFPVFNLDERQWQAIDRYSASLVEKTVSVIGAACWRFLSDRIAEDVITVTDTTALDRKAFFPSCLIHDGVALLRRREKPQAARRSWVRNRVQLAPAKPKPPTESSGRRTQNQ